LHIPLTDIHHLNRQAAEDLLLFQRKEPQRKTCFLSALLFLSVPAQFASTPNNYLAVK